MAITATLGAAASSSAAATSFGFQVGIAASAGDVLVIVLSQDNGGSSGVQSLTAPTLINSTTGKGTVTSRRQQNWDPGAADAGITQGIYELLLTAPVEATDWIQCNSSASDRMSACVIRVQPDPGFALAFSATGGTTGASTAAPTHTTAANVTSGDIIIAGYSGATNATVTLDSDTSNGSWSAQLTSKSDSGTLGTSTTVAAQYKVVTGTATQTYNPTTGAAADCVVGYVTYTQATTARAVTAWRWYADGVGLGAALAAENTIPVLTAAQNKNVVLRLRATLRANANVTETLSLQYKTDWSGTWVTVPAIASTLKDMPRYANGADTAGNAVARVLTGADTNGVYIEATASSQTVNIADNDKEFDWSVSIRYAWPATRIYFRINGAGGAWEAKGLTGIALDSPAEADWEDNNGVHGIVSKTFGPTSGADARNFEAFRPRLIYDGSLWWMFYFKEVENGGAAVRTTLYYRSYNGTAWSAESTFTLTTAYTTLKMYGLSVQFGNNAGTKHVFVAYQSSSTVTRFYRGTISGATIGSWTAETSVTTTMDTTSQGALTISDDGFLFYHGLTTAITTNIFRVMRSTNAYDASAWGTIADGGGAAARVAAAQADHTIGVSLGNNSVLLFGIASDNATAGTLYCRRVSGSGGTISFDGSTVQVNATTNCHPTNWSAFKNSSADIFFGHSDGAAGSDTGALVLRVSQDSGATWTTCTTPAVTMDGVSVDGVWVVDDGARGCYLFYTGAEAGSGGNTTEVRYKHYTVTGSAVTTGSWSGATVLFGTGMGNADATAAYNLGGDKILAFQERGDDDAVTTLEFYICYGVIALLTPQVGAFWGSRAA